MAGNTRQVSWLRKPTAQEKTSSTYWHQTGPQTQALSQSQRRKTDVLDNLEPVLVLYRWVQILNVPNAERLSAFLLSTTCAMTHSCQAAEVKGLSVCLFDRKPCNTQSLLWLPWDKRSYDINFFAYGSPMWTLKCFIIQFIMLYVPDKLISSLKKFHEGLLKGF